MATVIADDRPLEDMQVLEDGLTTPTPQPHRNQATGYLGDKPCKDDVQLAPRLVATSRAANLAPWALGFRGAQEVVDLFDGLVIDLCAPRSEGLLGMAQRRNRASCGGFVVLTVKA
jgi:hypothetical protein